ncbi:lysozyme-like protein [Coccomyxa subellipsoidea C-169]|uniref:Lysozyme-like protein n=1 Tax=Coccomyxa subellipsoidea (strain C-169) TaxID=574566 RepID=I0Z6C2_COCSC|nr:lysozyme-like protein [Coccomyxa subellipsoidea C-169]EIE26191.1 lysozyme-like protein [Coccomyxa subellipsoidea C-169]|eukprot:XP_005650735.1 lysozyme-like protein [Coccomyxa subellipsoidea C-169]
MAIDNAADLIKDHEGFRSDVYEDTTGNLTIGWGHKLPPGSDVQTVTDEQAKKYFDDDYRVAAGTAAQFVSNYDSLTTARQAVLIDMAFNLGRAGLAGFVNFKRALEAEDYEEAARQMLDSRWARQTGRRATEDAAIMRSGTFN